MKGKPKWNRTPPQSKGNRTPPPRPLPLWLWVLLRFTTPDQGHPPLPASLHVSGKLQCESRPRVCQPDYRAWLEAQTLSETRSQAPPQPSSCVCVRSVHHFSLQAGAGPGSLQPTKTPGVRVQTYLRGCAWVIVMAAGGPHPKQRSPFCPFLQI